MTDPVAHLKSLIRDIPDFPKKGVMFRDITPLLSDASGLALSIELLANPFRGQHIDLVIGAESRGFIFGTAVACCLSAGFGIVRKPGKLPFRSISKSYALEYGESILEMHEDAIRPQQFEDELLFGLPRRHPNDGRPAGLGSHRSHRQGVEALA